MSNFQPGDLVTFRLRGEQFGLAKILHIENLSQFDHYHIAIRDAVLDAGPGGLDEQGDPYERTHHLEGIENAPVVVDHLGLTLDAFMASDPLYVGEEPVAEDDLYGYQVYLHIQRENAIRRGMLRPDEVAEEEPEEELEGDEPDAMDDADVEGDDAATPNNEGREQESEAASESAEGEDSEDETEPERIEAHSWHMQLFDHPIGDVLLELHEVFAGEKFRDTELGAYITSFFDGSNSEEIEDLVSRFVEGDYGAGQELSIYGDAAVGPLAAHLNDQTSPELADDILQILCNSGSNKAYQCVATFFKEHGWSGDDPLALPAARAYCYAVMLTGGTPEPLRSELPILDRITDPELADDVRMAREAVENQPAEQQPVQQGTSTDPFGSL